jgi:hypothetical protein
LTGVWKTCAFLTGADGQTGLANLGLVGVVNALALKPVLELVLVDILNVKTLYA